MNVVPLVEQPTWIDHANLETRRFDPLYYDPALTIAECLCKAGGKLTWKRLHEVTTDIYSFGAYELTNRIRFVEPGPNTVPFINVTEIGNLYVDIGQARHIDVASHRLLHKSVCFPGTVLLSMSGSIGRVAVVPGCVKECNSNQHLAKIVVDDEESDPYFIAAYFASSIGQASCNREAAGAVQKELYLYNISSLPIPDIPRPLRLAIGNKVRAAEQLRTAAGLAWNTTQDTVLRLLSDVSLVRTNRCTFSYVSTALTSRRIDADYYRDDDLVIRDALLRLGFVPLATQCEFIQSGNTLRNPYGSFQIVGVASLRTPVIKPSSEGYTATASAIRLQPGDILLCNAAHDSSFIGRLNSVVGETTNLVPSSEVTVCRPKIASHGLVIAHFLNTSLGYLQIQRAVRGMTAHLYPDDLGEVLVPPFKNDYNGWISKLVDLTVGWRRAESLVNEAVDDVGKLIKGCLDEAECIEQGWQLADEFSLERL